jgi:ketosteroid isomerase-like protein
VTGTAEVTDEERRAANLARMRAHFAALDTPDPDAVLAQLSDDFVFDLPFAPELPPFDRAAFEGLIRHNAATYERHSTTMLEELPTVDPDVVVVRYDGDSRWAGGVPYVNRYVAIYRFRDGQITGITEFHNPKIVDEARAAASTAAAGGTAD